VGLVRWALIGPARWVFKRPRCWWPVRLAVLAWVMVVAANMATHGGR